MKISAIKDNNKTLSEALGQPYPYKWTEKSDRRYVAEYGKLMIAFMRRRLVLGKGAGRWTIAFDIDGDEGITGKGDAFKILSTVVAATKEWWGQQDAKKVSTIEFSATKGSGEGNGRTALYRRFATQFANDIGFVMRNASGHTTTATTTYVLTNPNFQLNVNEDGKVVQGVNTTPDVKPGETQRQSAKFGNKLNSKGEPPLLNAKARKNSSPHVLGNLGLAESQQINELFDKGYAWRWATKDGDTRIATFDVGGEMVEVFFTAMSKGSPNWETGFKKSGGIRRTGEGDQFRIFATVINIIETFMLENKEAESLTFAAKREGAAAEDPKIRDSRAELYKRMVSKFAKKHNFEFVWTQVFRMTEFLLRRKDINEDASLDGGLKQLQAKLTSQYNLKDLWLSDMATRDAFEVSSIIVNKDEQRTGTGTAVMQELIAYADKNDKIVVLDPALKDKTHGTTSQSRLRKFYKRFGFIENKGRNKNYVFRSGMIRYPQTKKVTEDMQVDTYGYKAMNYNPETGEITSGADSRVTKGIKLRKGMTLKMPGKGIFMSTNREYIENYYSGHNDHEVLIKFKFDPATITSGNLTDRENEFTVSSATVVGFKVIDNLNESHQLNELFDQPYNWQWKIEPDPMDASSQAVFTTHDGKPMHVGFDKHNDVHFVDFMKNFAFGATDEGDQFRIFATVMQVISDYVKKADPKVIAFTAEKNPRTNSSSRIKLYKRMVAKFAQQINMKFDVKDDSVETKFRLTKNNMNESLKKPKPKDTLGYKRHEMPQVHKQHYPELFKYLADNGGKMTKGMVKATSLKAVQSEFSDEGIEKMMRKGGITGDGTKKPLLVSSDNYIIDGHHRWLAAWNNEETVLIIKISIPVRKLLQLVQDFKHTTYRGIYKEGVQDGKTSKNRRVNRNRGTDE